jgi:hypothetical protein
LADSQTSLLAEVRSGANRELQLRAAEGLLPLPPEQLLPLQVELARGEDADLARRAAAALKELDPRLVAPFLAGAADSEVLAYFAAEASHPVLVEAVLRRRDVPRPLLVELAGRLSPDLQEVLLLRQDAIVEEPAILDALERNPYVSPYTQRRIGEYREHLLPRQRRPEVAPVPAGPHEPGEPDAAALAAAIEAARRLPAEGEVEERTGLTENQLRSLPVPARMRLARHAPRLLRTFLLRDPNARVALTVLQNPQLSEQEVEQIARSRNIIEDVLEEIARHRDWVAKPGILRALAQNPKTPIPTALRLVPRLSVRELRELSRDRNIADAVRSTAARLYRIKRQ